MDKKINEQIFIIDNNISKNISRFDESERGLLSQNILSQLRNLIELIFLKIYNKKENKSLEPIYENFRIAEKYVKRRGALKFLWKFHNLLQISTSHYTLDENASERLMLKYYEYLLRIKSFLKDEYEIEVFSNINEFPINLDKTTQEYYEKIAQQINSELKTETRKDRYYIQKIKPFFVDNDIYYEVTFTKSHDKISKFDRIIAFTKLDIIQNYAVNLYIRRGYIKILGAKMPINIVEKWEISIRPCELDNFSRLFGENIKISSKHKEYKELMKFLTETELSLNDYILQDQNYYDFVKQKATDGATKQFFNILDKCRDIALKNQAGSNIIRYLLYTMNNKIIKKQTCNKPNFKLSDLHIRWGCIPFDQMPFATSLINHNPRIFDLFESINVENREHEFLARKIQNNSEIEGELFTPSDEMEIFQKKDINNLIKKHNNLIYKKTQSNRIIKSFKNKFYYMQGYVEDTINIVKILQDLSSGSIKNYSNSVKAWIEENKHDIDCEDKKNFLINMFEHSKVAMIYGAAGTGKSTMINHISHFFKDKTKIYLAQTNPAVDNLKRKVDTSNCEFMTIAKFKSTKNHTNECTILFIDECSTVSNRDMIEVLNKSKFSLLVLVGDIFQIESIRFGNWFEVSKEFLPKKSIFELVKPYRSSNEKLLTLWDKVRKLDHDDDILEQLEKNNYSTKLDESIFENYEDDEIILCLNYDGLYGINNINRFLQVNNTSKAVEWGGLIYKVNDPILFNETQRFGNAIYNNLKGKILGINLLDKQIEFIVEIEKVVNELDIQFYDLELIDSNENKSIIRFRVNEFPSTDEDKSDSDAIVPFQIAYAVSIHKAQGLEYKSVKIVITDEAEEQISHNIFYTAITRAKEKLKIYWSPETENKILKRLKHRNRKRDIGILRGMMK